MRREERVWNIWFWGLKGDVVWDENGCMVLCID